MVTQSSLFARPQAGAAMTVEEFIQQYQPVVYRLAISILSDPAEAEDVTQEAVMAALDALDSYRGDAALKTWVYSIALNACRRRLQKGHTRERLQQALTHLFRRESHTPSLEEAASRDEEREIVWRAVTSLDDTYRLPVLLRYYEGLSIAEIAEALKTSERTVYVRLNKAHDRLKGMLKGRVEWVWQI